ncbi:MAG: hypothetical protein U9Q81_27130 [Pseudomonadota bacterium]|nr:hypothetical protein [Pseudomonadota bacterium]
MPEFIHNVNLLYRSQLVRHRNRPFLRAAMAACALVSMANGAVSLRQRVRVDRVMETLDALKIFDPHEGVELFNEFVEGLNEDADAGRRRAMEVVAREVGQDLGKARLLARICLAVSEREGAIPPAERCEIAELCRCIGLEPGAYDLDGGGAIQAATPRGT